MTQNPWDAAKVVSSKRKVYSNTIPPQQMRKISNKQRNLTPKAVRERRTKPIISRSKERKKEKIKQK